MHSFPISASHAHLTPISEGAGPEKTVVGSCNFLAIDSEMISDDAVDGDKHLSMLDGLETPENPLPLADGFMRTSARLFDQRLVS